MNEFLKRLKPVGEVILFILCLPLVPIVILLAALTSNTSGGIRRPPQSDAPLPPRKEVKYDKMFIQR